MVSRMQGQAQGHMARLPAATNSSCCLKGRVIRRLPAQHAAVQGRELRKLTCSPALSSKRVHQQIAPSAPPRTPAPRST